MLLEGASRRVEVNVNGCHTINLKVDSLGDSGGGFLYWDAHSRQWTIYGIVSKGITSNFGCNLKSYVVFVSVHKYLAWIQEIVPDGEHFRA